MLKKPIICTCIPMKCKKCAIFAKMKKNVSMDSIIKSSVKEPFDPSTLKAEVKNATIGQLVEMLRNNLIDMNPDFQRHSNLWTNSKKSQLIESILLGLPLPSFYFYNDSSKEKWVVIDGLQRLCALKSFMVDGDLKLKDLEFLDSKKYGIHYKNFSYYDKLAISMHPVTLNVLSGSASAEARYIIFQRVNSKGTQLNPIEIRNALYQGAATQLISRLVENDLFKRMVATKISTERMKDREFVSRFLTFYLNDYNRYIGYKKLDIFISKAMDDINKQFEGDKCDIIVDAFNRSLSTCMELLGDDAFRKPSLDKKRKNQLSLAIFEMLTVTIAHLDYNLHEELIRRKELFGTLYRKLFKDPNLQKFLSDGTGKPRAIKYRFQSIENVINQTLFNQ